MTPASPPAHLVDDLRGDRETTREHGTRFRAGPNLTNHLRRQFRGMMIHAVPETLFLNRIRDVIAMRTQKEMPRIDTATLIARMTDELTTPQGTIQGHP